MYPDSAVSPVLSLTVDAVADMFDRTLGTTVTDTFELENGDAVCPLNTRS